MIPIPGFERTDFKQNQLKISSKLANRLPTNWGGGGLAKYPGQFLEIVSCSPTRARGAMYP